VCYALKSKFAVKEVLGMKRVLTAMILGLLLAACISGWAQVGAVELARVGRITQEAGLYAGAVANAPKLGVLYPGTFFSVLNKQGGWWYAEALASVAGADGQELKVVKGFIPGWKSVVGRKAIIASLQQPGLVVPVNRMGLGAPLVCGPVVEDFNGDGIMEAVVGTTSGDLFCLQPTSGVTEWLARLQKRTLALVAVPLQPKESGVQNTIPIGEIGKIKHDVPVAQSAEEARQKAVEQGLMALRRAVGAREWEVVASDGSQVVAFSGNSGALNWRWGLQAGGPVKLVASYFDPVVAVLSQTQGLAVLKASDGTEVWKKEQFKPAPGAYAAVGDVTGDGNTNLVVESTGGLLACMDLLTGQPRWSAQAVILQPCLARDDYYGEVVVGYDQATKQLVCLRGTDGTAIWRQPLGGAAVGISLGDVNYDRALDVVVTKAGGQAGLQVFRLRDGSLEYTVKAPSTPTSAALLGNLDYDSKIEAVFNTQTGVEACHPTTGEVLWQLWAGGGTLAPVVGNFDSDGLTDLLVAGRMDGVFLLRTAPSPRSYMWPAARGDAVNSGNASWAAAYGNRLIEVR